MSENQLPIPDFVDVDPTAVAAAEASVQRGGNWVPPQSVNLSAPTGKKNARHARWNEQITIQSAYRTVTKTNLIDVVLVVKARTGSANADNGNSFLHFYLSPFVMNKTASEEQMKKHGGMTESALGMLAQLARLTGFMPKSGGLKASLLSTLFPPKGQPGVKSPIDGKSLTVRLHYSETPKQVKDEATGEMVNTVDVRLEADTFMPAEVTKTTEGA